MTLLIVGILETIVVIGPTDEVSERIEGAKGFLEAVRTFLDDTVDVQEN